WIESRIGPGQRQAAAGEIQARVGNALHRLERALDPADAAAAMNAVDDHVHGCDAVGGAARIMRIVGSGGRGHFSTTRLFVRYMRASSRITSRVKVHCPGAVSAMPRKLPSAMRVTAM